MLEDGPKSVSIPLIRSGFHPAVLYTAWQTPLKRNVLVWDDIHPESRAKIESHPCSLPLHLLHLVEHAKSLMLYVDGSAKDDPASWGVVVCIYCCPPVGDPFETFVGTFGGFVALDGPFYIGATAHSAPSAELTAAHHALLFGLSIYPELKLPVVVGYDASIIGGVTSFSQAVQAHPVLVATVRLLSVALSNITSVQWKHIKSHSGHPFNELVDRTCAHITATDMSSHQLPSPLAVIASQFPMDLDWLFLFFAPPHLRSAYPPITAGHILLSPPVAMPVKINIDPLALPDQVHKVLQDKKNTIATLFSVGEPTETLSNYEHRNINHINHNNNNDNGSLNDNRHNNSNDGHHSFNDCRAWPSTKSNTTIASVPLTYNPNYNYASTTTTTTTTNDTTITSSRNVTQNQNLTSYIYCRADLMNYLDVARLRAAGRACGVAGSFVSKPRSPCEAVGGRTTGARTTTTSTTTSLALPGTAGLGMERGQWQPARPKGMTGELASPVSADGASRMVTPATSSSMSTLVEDDSRTCAPDSKQYISRSRSVNTPRLPLRLHLPTTTTTIHRPIVPSLAIGLHVDAKPEFSREHPKAPLKLRSCCLSVPISGPVLSFGPPVPPPNPHLQPPPVRTEPASRAPSQPIRPKKRRLPYSLSFVFSSANVLTLEPKEQEAQQKTQGLNVVGRIAELQRQFSEALIHFVGLQEARTKKGERLSALYYCISSGATRGNWGCELWISLVYDFSTDLKNPCYFTPGQATVLHSDSLHLLVSVRMKCLAVDILVTHAPHHGKPPAEIQAFWEGKNKILSHRKNNSVPLVVLADTNARIGSVVSDSVGPYSPDPQDDLGECFHTFLLQNQLFIPSTFPEYTDPGPTHTWVSHTGTKHRIDFIGVPYKWSSTATLRARVLRDVCLAVTRQDHYAVALSVQIEHDPQQVPIKRRSPIFDKKALSDPKKNEAFSLSLSSIVPPPWPLDSHQSLAYLNVQFLARAAQACPIPVYAPKKSHISDSTWELVCKRKERWLQLEDYHEQLAEIEALDKSKFSEEATQFSNEWKDELISRVAEVKKYLADTIKPYKASHKQDRQAQVERIQVVAKKAAEDGDSKTLYRCQRQLSPYKPRQQPQVLLADGTPQAPHWKASSDGRNSSGHRYQDLQQTLKGSIKRL